MLQICLFSQKGNHDVISSSEFDDDFLAVNVLLSTTMSTFPDYYEILKVDPSATDDEVRTAYKRESLVSHPDRLVNATPQEKKQATERFQGMCRSFFMQQEDAHRDTSHHPRQALADAYYVLRDPTRRKEYGQPQGHPLQKRTHRRPDLLSQLLRQLC